MNFLLTKASVMSTFFSPGRFSSILWDYFKGGNGENLPGEKNLLIPYQLCRQQMEQNPTCNKWTSTRKKGELPACELQAPSWQLPAPLLPVSAQKNERNYLYFTEYNANTICRKSNSKIWPTMICSFFLNWIQQVFFTLWIKVKATTARTRCFCRNLTNVPSLFHFFQMVQRHLKSMKTSLQEPNLWCEISGKQRHLTWAFLLPSKRLSDSFQRNCVAQMKGKHWLTVWAARGVSKIA